MINPVRTGTCIILASVFLVKIYDDFRKLNLDDPAYSRWRKTKIWQIICLIIATIVATLLLSGYDEKLVKTESKRWVLLGFGGLAMFVVAYIEDLYDKFMKRIAGEVSEIDDKHIRTSKNIGGIGVVLGLLIELSIFFGPITQT